MTVCPVAKLVSKMTVRQGVTIVHTRDCPH